MCREWPCDKCNRRSWWGRCQLHIKQVMDKIPYDERCICEPKICAFELINGVKTKVGDPIYPPMAHNPYYDPKTNTFTKEI